MTDTDKWKKPFLKSLPAEYKLFWLFVLDECDYAGIWHVEMEVAEARLGIKLSKEKIRGFFRERIVEFDGGNKMFIPDFIDFQYGNLNPANKVHASVLGILSKYNLPGRRSPSHGAKETATDKDKEKEQAKEVLEPEYSAPDPIHEMFVRAIGARMPESEIRQQVGMFKNKYPHLHPNQAGPVINSWVSRIGEETRKPFRKSTYEPKTDDQW